MMEAKSLTKREAEIAELFAWGRKQERHCETPFHFGTDGGKSCPERKPGVPKSMSYPHGGFARNSTFPLTCHP